MTGPSAAEEILAEFAPHAERLRWARDVTTLPDALDEAVHHQLEMSLRHSVADLLELTEPVVKAARERLVVLLKELSGVIHLKLRAARELLPAQRLLPGDQEAFDLAREAAVAALASSSGWFLMSADDLRRSDGATPQLRALSALAFTLPAGQLACVPLVLARLARACDGLDLEELPSDEVLETAERLVGDGLTLEAALEAAAELV